MTAYRIKNIEFLVFYLFFLKIKYDRFEMEKPSQKKRYISEFIRRLPADIFRLLLTYLPLKEKINLLRTQKYFYQLYYQNYQDQIRLRKLELFGKNRVPNRYFISCVDGGCINYLLCTYSTQFRQFLDLLFEFEYPLIFGAWAKRVLTLYPTICRDGCFSEMKELEKSLARVSRKVKTGDILCFTTKSINRLKFDKIDKVEDRPKMKECYYIERRNDVILIRRLGNGKQEITERLCQMMEMTPKFLEENYFSLDLCFLDSEDRSEKIDIQKNKAGKSTHTNQNEIPRTE